MILEHNSERRQRQASQRSRLQVPPSSAHSGIGSLLTRPIQIQRQLSAAARVESLERQMLRMRSRVLQNPSPGASQPHTANTDSSDEPPRSHRSHASRDGINDPRPAGEAEEDLVTDYGADHDALQLELVDSPASAEDGEQGTLDLSDPPSPAVAEWPQLQQLQHIIDVSEGGTSDILIAQAPVTLRSHARTNGFNTTSAQLRAMIRDHSAAYEPYASVGSMRWPSNEELLADDDDEEEEDDDDVEPPLPQHLQHMEYEEGRSKELPVVDLDMADPLKALHPQECPLLQSGARFEGKQSVSRAGVRDDDWTIALTVDQCEWDRGYLCGIMTAKNVPHSSTPVTTFFEAEIVGAGDNTFATKGPDSDREGDMSHWLKFPVFRTLQRGACSFPCYQYSDHVENILDDLQQDLAIADEQHPPSDMEALDEATELVLARMHQNSIARRQRNSTASAAEHPPVYSYESVSADETGYEAPSGSYEPRPPSPGFLFASHPSTSRQAEQRSTTSPSLARRRALQAQPRQPRSVPVTDTIRPSTEAALDDVVFLRIKEKSFLGVNTERRGLTIAGLYYCCLTMDQKGGATLEGFYHENRGQPFQRLLLHSVQSSDNGFSSSSFDIR